MYIPFCTSNNEFCLKKHTAHALHLTECVLHLSKGPIRKKIISFDNYFYSSVVQIVSIVSI